MTDRELLERAAKAAGMEVLWLPAAPGRRAMFWTSKTGEWDPLTDDGDALRLAARLCIDLQFHPEDGGSAWAWCPRTGDWIEEHDTGSRTLAECARRAIVRAAAEMCSD